jgi:hypothetical protein
VLRTPNGDPDALIPYLQWRAVGARHTPTEVRVGTTRRG